ncbi:helix-turn-helix domain-containing protein [Saccharomonospora iraqiensis]|uniref:helix-turn-helix domain-containing protein n=1 Tax=Saccharomonospora iraqiensis TaxID=52698 RepID=UPI000410F6F6|nr:helix-turn-helix domain-containing protein [Saccharomonospora iraqiensis]
MGIRLYVEVLDHAPAELTSNERLLLLVIAEKANDDTRRAVFPNPDRLLHRLGMSEDGLRKVCQKLAARGYEARIPVGTNKAGRPVYAYKGHAVDYRVPVFPRREVPPERRDNSPAIDTERQDNSPALEDIKAVHLSGKAVHQSAKGETDVRKGGTDVPPLPSDPSDVPQIPHRARDPYADAVDYVENGFSRLDGRQRYERQDIAEAVRGFLSGHQVANPAAYVRKAFDSNPEQFRPTPGPPRFRRESA